MKCGTSKESIQKEQRKERQMAQGGTGMMMMGVTPSRDFMKCSKCNKIACSRCASENCPFCGEKYTTDSIIVKSKSPFVQ